MNIENVQEKLKESGIDGWLFYDFHNRDPLAYRILGLDASKMTTRRWYYFIPAEGEPVRIVHSIEQARLDSLPGKKIIYRAWKEQHQILREVLSKSKRVAMQYSPMNSIPYVSMVDAGTIELIRSFGVEVISSADLVTEFEARIDRHGYELHKKAGVIMHAILGTAFSEITDALRKGILLTEFGLQQKMLHMYKINDMECDGMPPIVAVNEHASDPHFEPAKENSQVIKEGDLVLIDLWARKNIPEGIYYDITWMGYCGKEVPAKINEVFNVVKNARDQAVEFLREKIENGEKVHGYEVDDACRSVISEAGYEKYFTHRTGHSIGHEVHGAGTNIDNLETQDRRILGRGSLFSIEPGIYLPDFGVRSEINVFIHDNLKVEVTGNAQEEIMLLL
jgi:Xaa-Pro aminopeptidase